MVVGVELREGAADGGDDGEEPVRTLSVGDLLEGGSAESDHLGAELPGVGDEVLLPSDLLAAGVTGRAEQLGTDEEGLRADAGGQGQGELLVALDQRGAGLLAGSAASERDDRLERRAT